ncbi:ribonuclease BN [Halostagnicola sp. A56]|uniref:YihY/virulence factor BrkB family protein n=1 Tax=Halostagnicola sp. A56 TaxID=1495067 RepID=UPI0004A02107|nr:YihY/virulence factor BrkB family protein [Halostagnicola sp. A56]KDE59048.1 ribonuclease BN [Halostagnicola sp. A56]
MSWSNVRSLVAEITAVARERRVGVTAAGLAYHSFNALVPLVILLLVAVTVVDSLETVVDSLETMTGLEGVIDREHLDAVTSAGGNRTRAALLASGIFFWSSIRLFRAVNSAFTAVYGSRRTQSSLEAARSASLVTGLYTVLLVATVAVAVALVGALGVSASLIFTGPLATGASLLVLTGLLFVLFLPMYYVFPQPNVSICEIVPGTAFAAVTWSLLAVGFRVYVSTAETVALFDVAGAILLILTWVYFGGFCLLVGAVLNAVLADRVDADDGWVPLSGDLPNAS